LSPKEREKIVEEETLRFETRHNLQGNSCGRPCGRHRWLWFLAFFILGYAVHGLVRRGCPMGCHWDAMAPGHHCVMGEGLASKGPDGADGSAAAQPKP